MIIEVGGGKGGFKEYLETGQKKGRELHRDALDQRIPLFGDLNVFELATSTHGSGGRTYDHLTLSFSENNISDELLETAVLEFRDHALAAWPEEERHIAFYAEAHRPKILSYTNSQTGETVDRLIHIHIGMGRHDLITGKAIEPLGFLGEEADNLKFIDAWQESFNARHGLSSPKDNPKITPENAVDVLARYTGSKPDAMGTFNEQKADIEVVLQKEILSRNIITWDAFGELLAEHGEISKMNEGKFNECYRIKPTGAGRAMRLKGVFFGRQFIERSTAEKLSIIQEKARVAYLEQMQPRKEPGYVADVLQEWNSIKSRENRFIHTGSPFYKNKYLPADAETRLQLLDQLERNHHAKPSVVSNRGRKEIATARTRVPGLPSRNMDGIQSRSEMLLHGNSGVDVRTDAGGEQDSLGMRQTNGTTGRRGRGGDSADIASQDIKTARRGGRAGSRLRPGQSASTSDAGGPELLLAQPSSVIARMQADLLNQYDQANDKERYVEIRKNLDCGQLLARLSHSHGLNPELYQVATAKDGTPRIQCGSRALSPSDFLMKELGLPWKEAAPILRQTYEHQISGKATKPRFDKSAPAKMWKDFKAEQQPVKDELAKRLKVFDGTAKARRAGVADKLKADQKATTAGLSGDARKAAHSLEKLRAATVKAEFNIMLKEERDALGESVQPKNGWQLYLQKRAQEGDEEALIELRKLDDTARAKLKTTPSITGILILNLDEEEKKRRRARESSASILKSLAHTVEKNGDITYRQRGHAVLRDEGQHLAVLDENSEEAITAGLLIAREKFGTNLTLTGPADFQRRAVAVAVAQGIAVRFVDPQLEALRLRLTEEKRRPERVPVPAPELPPTQPEYRERTKRVPPAAEVPAAVIPIAPEVFAIPLLPTPLLSSSEWLAAQHKPVGPAHATGDGNVTFVVMHVADSIVLDHGQRVATYPLQPGLVLLPGQRVVITRAGTVALAPELAKPEAGKGGRAD